MVFVCNLHHLTEDWQQNINSCDTTVYVILSTLKPNIEKTTKMELMDVSLFESNCAVLNNNTSPCNT